MRIGTFLFGGIMGAAAVVYMQQRKKPSMLAGMVQPAQMMNRLAGMSNSSSSKNQSDKQPSSGGKADLNEVQHIVNKDPQLKETVDSILHEGTTH